MRATRNKYHATKTWLDGILFDSKREAARYAELKLLERAGEISGLELQPVYELIPPGDGERGVKYIADFRYVEGGKTVVEDVKSVATRKNKDYIIKRKLLKQIYADIEFREVH